MGVCNFPLDLAPTPKDKFGVLGDEERTEDRNFGQWHLRGKTLRKEMVTIRT